MTRWLSTCAMRDDHPVELGCGDAGGKIQVSRAAPTNRAHTGAEICLDGKNILG
jgi:hypothetical protein